MKCERLIQICTFHWQKRRIRPTTKQQRATQDIPSLKQTQARIGQENRQNTYFYPDLGLIERSCKLLISALYFYLFQWLQIILSLDPNVLCKKLRLNDKNTIGSTLRVRERPGAMASVLSKSAALKILIHHLKLLF